MTALDATWHLLNALAAPLILAVLACVWALLIWPQPQGWRVFPILLAWAAVPALVAQGVAWFWSGAEGTMGGYGLMILSCAAGVWLRLFIWPALRLRR